MGRGEVVVVVVVVVEAVVLLSLAEACVPCRGTATWTPQSQQQGAGQLPI